MQFQSTLEYLARPPAEYLIPGVDLIEGLLGIKAKLLEGSYDSQYDFIREFTAVVCFLRAFWSGPAYTNSDQPCERWSLRRLSSLG